MVVEEYVNNPLWAVLVETVHAMVMYPHHKAYVRDAVLHEQSEITAADLARANRRRFKGEKDVGIHV